MMFYDATPTAALSLGLPVAAMYAAIVFVGAVLIVLSARRKPPKEPESEAMYRRFQKRRGGDAA